MLLWDPSGGSGVKPTIWIWQESLSNFQKVAPIMLVISLRAFTDKKFEDDIIIT